MTDPKTGARMMKAIKVAGVDLEKVKVDMLRRLCSHYGIKKYRHKKKEDLLLLIAQVQQTHAAYNALDDDEATKAQKKENDKVRITNLLFSSEFYEEAVTMNDRKSRKDLDKGGAGSSKSLLVEMSSSFSDSLNDDIYGEVLFPDNPHIAKAALEGLNPGVFNEHNWMSLLASMKEIWKDYDKAITRFTKSGRHEQDLYGDGFTNTISTYYYHLHVKEKPESHKAYSAVIDDDIFAEAGLGKRHKKSTSSNKKGALTSAAALKEESMKRVATAAFESIQQDQRRNAARKELYAIDRLVAEAIKELEHNLPGTRLYDHYQQSLDEMLDRKKDLKKKLEWNPSPDPKEKK
jgi:hypothetical protein